MNNRDKKGDGEDDLTIKIGIKGLDIHVPPPYFQKAFRAIRWLATAALGGGGIAVAKHFLL